MSALYNLHFYAQESLVIKAKDLNLRDSTAGTL
ncbi:MAG: hypothetical protein K0S24_967 [Sphingobacterium sp.]|jgi:hypothetical protein|nr:hypothetical protein [Sphingobacterium sp.]